MFISKSKKTPFYQLTYEVNGKRTTISTKTSNEKEAQEFLIKFKYSLIEKPQKSIIPVINSTTIFLSAFEKEYLEYSYPTKSKKYCDSISFSFKQLISFCGDLAFDKIDTRILDKFVTSAYSRTQRGAHHYYRTLKAAFNKAVEWNYIETNPFTKIKFPKLSKSFPTFISEDELLIILTNTPYQYLKDIFIVGFYTGLRLGELINMKWNWIDFFQNHITVKCSNDFITKSKKERIVPMSEKVKSILITRFNLAVHQPDEIVFFRIQKRKLHQETISKQFKEAVRKSNLNENIHFHSLRHSFASLLAQKGVSLYVIKELLGHTDLATTQIYSHLQQQNLRDAINIL
ncbi:MAG: site-specific recombinase phage integrase family [Ignavibacteria bacterium]|nr:MAG: site-specific recombinase phage integrase family [Ignavibacteria bacterium]KAF0150568.1 MAG: site-specific recombinase phage integrase family [Ignavibacteria bacterium]